MKFTEEQIKSIQTTEGNMLIYASAGSGKSTCLTHRINHLINELHVEPYNILGLTFTKTAAENMRYKLENLMNPYIAKQINLLTFHSFAYKCMNQWVPEKYQGMSLIDNRTKWLELQIANDIAKQRTEKNLDGCDLKSIDKTFYGGHVLDFISYQKSSMIKPTDPVLIDKHTPLFKEEHRNILQKAYMIYDKRMKNANKITFDDMLLDFYNELLINQELLSHVRDKFKYILVDEFQDTSKINIEILRLISNNNVTVYCDQNQSIYSFINSNVENINNFMETFNDVQVIKLPHNFRSTVNIVDCSYDLLSSYRGEEHPYNTYAKQVSARGIDGAPIHISVHNDSDCESAYVIKKIDEIMKKNPELSFTDFAIISRTNNSLVDYENTLTNFDIPYHITGGKSFYDRNEIIDLLCYAALADGPHDDSYRRVANKPNRFLSNDIIRSLDEFCKVNQIPLEQGMSHGFDAHRYTRGLKNFNDVIYRIRRVTKFNNAEKMLRQIYDITNYKEFVLSSTSSNTEATLKFDNIEKLFEIASKFANLKQLLGYIGTVAGNKTKEADGITLTTVHSAKGLEWSYVFLIGANDANFPHKMMLEEDKDEELRLMFVGFTRAQNELFISIPIFDSGNKVIKPSRFITNLLGESLEQAVKEIKGGSRLYEFDYVKE